MWAAMLPVKPALAFLISMPLRSKSWTKAPFFFHKTLSIYGTPFDHRSQTPGIPD